MKLWPAILILHVTAQTAFAQCTFPPVHWEAVDNTTGDVYAYPIIPGIEANTVVKIRLVGEGIVSARVKYPGLCTEWCDLVAPWESEAYRVHANDVFAVWLPQWQKWMYEIQIEWTQTASCFGIPIFVSPHHLANVPIIPAVFGDLDYSGHVDPGDISVWFDQFGNTGPSIANLDGDNDVDIDDLLIVLANWGGN